MQLPPWGAHSAACRGGLCWLADNGAACSNVPLPVTHPSQDCQVYGVQRFWRGFVAKTGNRLQVYATRLLAVTFGAIVALTIGNLILPWQARGVGVFTL